MDLWKGTAYYASLTPTVAYVQDPRSRGTTLLAVDLRTGKTTKVGTVPIYDVFQLVLNNAATRLGGASYHEAGACCPRLVVIDLTRRPISLRAIAPPTELGPSGWLGDDLFAFFGDETMFVYDTELRLVTRVANWRSLQGAAVGSTVFGVRSDGTLVSVKLPSGRVRVVRHLPGSAEVIVATGQ